jgi:hypothetical protein
MNDTVTIIAKGPSAANASRFIARSPGTHIATINDAGALFPSRPITWCFFTDVIFLKRNIVRHHRRIQTYVSPRLSEKDKKEVPNWVTDWVQYPENSCTGFIDDMEKRVVSGGICHHNTVNGAIHWLAKHGKYRTIRILGVDGGRDYAPNVNCVGDETHKKLVDSHGTLDYLDVWKEATKTVCHLVKRVYAVNIEWSGLP